MSFVGIDVGKASLAVATTPAAPTLPRQVANAAAGIARLIAALVDPAPTLVVLEATGVSHRPVLAARSGAGVPVAVANPAQVAAVRQARLGRQKTDHTDAALLARCAQVPGEDLRRAVPADPRQARLRESVADRDALVAARSATCAVMHKLLRRMMGRLRAFSAEQAPPLPLAA